MEKDKLSKEAALAKTPFAYGKAVDVAPKIPFNLADEAKRFKGASIGENYFGPAWLSEAGVAHVVLISHSEKTPRILRAAGACALLVWRWNVTPSSPLTLTLMLPQKNQRPHIRWIRASDDPVATALRKGNFMFNVVHPSGVSSGWFEGKFSTAPGGPVNTTSLARQWEFPTPGIPRSSIHHSV